MPVIIFRSTALWGQMLQNPILILGTKYTLSVDQDTGLLHLVVLCFPFVRMITRGHLSRRLVQVSVQNFFFYYSGDFTHFRLHTAVVQWLFSHVNVGFRWQCSFLGFEKSPGDLSWQSVNWLNVNLKFGLIIVEERK